MTIVEAIAKVMRDRGRPMTAAQVFDAIVGAGLYTFHADDPEHVVRAQIRRHCKELSFPSASPTKYFTMLADGTYFVLPKPTKQVSQPSAKHAGGKRDLGDELRKLHARYLEQFRERLLQKIKQLDPTSFELFAKRLLDAYGFRDVCVTQKTRDGGIDGHGQLKVGLADLSVAFQCKQWRTKPVGRPELDQFRGAIQGKHEHGILFTTGKFTNDAKGESIRKGAAPIILLDGQAIVAFMIEHVAGVEEIESLPIYSYALDNFMAPDRAPSLRSTSARRTRVQPSRLPAL